MDTNSLVIDDIEAGARLAREFHKILPVTAVFWLKASDDDRSYLYIASDGVDDSNLRTAYRGLVDLAGSTTQPMLDLMRVKLVNSNNPLAKAAIETQRLQPRPAPTRTRGWFGERMVDDVYLYPSPLPQLAS